MFVFPKDLVTISGVECVSPKYYVLMIRTCVDEMMI
jgi:hypothetical protein